MRRCSGSGALVPLFMIRPRTSSLPLLFPASSLAFPLMRLAGSLTTPPRDVSFPLRTPRLTSRFPFAIPSPTALPLPPPPLFLAPGPPPTKVLVEVLCQGVLRLGVLSLRVRSLGVPCGAGGTGGAGAAGLGGACTRGTGAAGVGGAGGAGAGDPGAGDARGGGIGAGGTCAGGARAGGAGARDPIIGDARAGGTDAGGVGAGDPGAGGTGAGGASAGGTGAVDPGAGGAGAGGAASGGTGAGGTMQRRPFFVLPPPSSLPPPDSVLRQVLTLPSSSGLPPTLLSPPPCYSQPQLQPDSPLPTPSPYVEQIYSFTERHEPESRPASPVCAVLTGSRVPRPRSPPVLGTHIMALCPSSVPLRVPLPPPPKSSLHAVPDPESDLAPAASPTVPRLLAIVVTDPSFESTIACALVAELVDFAAAYRLDYATALVAESESTCPPSVGDPDALDIPTPRSYAEAITGPYSSQWQTTMDVEMASWKSTGTYINEVPPSGTNIVDGMWIFMVKRPPSSPPVFKARYVARGFSQQQGVDFFHIFSPTPKMTILRVLLHVAP
ncbi:unnamed protein product [Closterium sp. NIES-54]